MSVPWIGSRPPTAPPQPKQSVRFQALCQCGAAAWWVASASDTTDHTRTKVEYTIECVVCPPAVEAKEIA